MINQKPDPKTMERSDFANDTLFRASKQVVPKVVTSQSDAQGSHWLEMIENTKCTNRMSGYILRSSKLTCSSSRAVHESVMVSHHESGMVFRSLFAFAFLNPFFTIFGAFMCVSNAFFYKGCMSLISGQKTGPSTGDNVFSGCATSRDTADLDAEWGGVAPNTQGSMAGNIWKIWKNQLAVFVGGCFFKCFFPEFHSATG